MRFCLLYVLLFINSAYAQTWSNLDSGLIHSGCSSCGVSCLESYNGNLFASGEFTSASSVPCIGFAQWNGTKWDSVKGMYPDGALFKDLTVFNGFLYGAGNYSLVNDIPLTKQIAKWDGTQWTSGGYKNNDEGTINCLAVYNNELYAAGNITKVSGNTVNRIARWTGTQWVDVGGGVDFGFTPTINAMTVFKGKLYVAGDFWKAGGKNAYYIASWDGTKWDSVGTGLNNLVTCMAVDTVKENLYVGGGFDKAGSLPCYGLATWNGNEWSSMDSIITTGIVKMAFYHAELYVSGNWTNFQPTDTLLIRWTGNKWEPVTGPAGSILSLFVYKDDLYVGGAFKYVNNLLVNNIAKWNTPGEGILEKKRNSNVYLENNEPNPFNDRTEIKYHLPAGKKGEIKIFNGTGITIAEYNLKSGNDKIIFNAKDLPAGVYYYSMYIDGELVESKKMVLIR